MGGFECQVFLVQMASNSEDDKIPSSSEDIEEDKKTDEPATQNATPSGESTTSSDQATPPGEGPAPSSHSSGTGRGTGANMGVSSQQKIIQTLSSEGHVCSIHERGDRNEIEQKFERL